jgi:hypothetical protein
VIDPSAIDERQLSPVARLTAQAVGLDGLLALMAAYAGQEIMVPLTPDGSEKLNAILSHEKRCALVQRYQDKTDRRLYIPKQDRILSQLRAEQVRALRAEGLSGTEVARRMNLSRRWVVHLSGDADDDNQGELF